MATASVANKAAAMRAKVQRELSIGISLVSPTVYCLLNGVPKGTAELPLSHRALKNVKWAQGGSSADWRVKKTRSKGTVSTGTLATRNVAEKNLFASPSVSHYMFDQTWGVGEGDLALNRHAGDQKILDLRKENLQDAVDAIMAEFALLPWNANETNQNGGLTMFSPTNVGASTTYAGIAMNASATNGTDTFYYWKPTGYDYGTAGLSSNLIADVSTLSRQMTFSMTAGGQGLRRGPDFGVCSEELWPYLLAYWEINGVINMEKIENLSILGDVARRAIVVCGIPIFWDENFGGSTGYIDGSATEEILLGSADQYELRTTNTRGEGLMTIHNSGAALEALIAGEMGVVKTGMMASIFKDPRAFQILYT